MGCISWCEYGCLSYSPVWLPSTPSTRRLCHLETTKDSSSLYTTPVGPNPRLLDVVTQPTSQSFDHIQLVHTCHQVLVTILHVANKTVSNYFNVLCKCKIVYCIECALCSMVQGCMQCGVFHSSVCGVCVHQFTAAFLNQWVWLLWVPLSLL